MEILSQKGNLKMEKQNQLQIFNFQNSAVRTTVINGDLWWIAKDVCNILDLSNPTNALRSIDDDDLTLLKVRAGCQDREMNIINEAGLYTLILRSNKPQAKAFKRWVTHEVLPSIRRTGSYSLQQNDVIAAMAAQLERVTETLAHLQAQFGAVVRAKPEIQKHDGVFMKQFYRPVSNTFSPESLTYIAECLKDADIKKKDIYNALLKIGKAAGWKVGSRPSFYRITVTIEGTTRYKHKRLGVQMATQEPEPTDNEE